MTALEWLAFIILLIVGVTAGAAVTLSNGAVTGAIRRLERTYRQQKSLELEQLQAQLVAGRRAEVEAALARPDGWRKVLDQLLADALGEAGASVGPAGVLDLSVEPAPRFTVSGENGRLYLFTTAPELLRKVGLVGRREEPLPLDASLHPAARAEVQAVWEHLAAQRLTPRPASGVGGTTLPRQAGWFLVVRAGATGRSPQQRTGNGKK